MTPQQLSVIEHLLLGRSITESAAHARVSRATVHRWLQDDFEFIATYNAERTRQHEAVSRRLVSIADAAVTCLEGAIQNGDIRAALSVLKGIGALDGVVPSFGATSPRRLELDAKHEEAQLELEEILTN